MADTSDEHVKGTWVRIRKTKWRFIDAKTGETIVSYNTLGAAGGWFVRTFYNERSGPFFFRGDCVPPNEPGLSTLENIGANYIERPKHIHGDTK